MTREEVVATVNKFLIEEIEIDANLIKDNALLKDDLGSTAWIS
jgi:hypothetical protein